MHIPDGYLSPSTCATLYVGAAAGWYSALRRLKRVLFTRVVPLISVFAAFSFVVMMFNLPLPGGTTGHALGVTIAAIVLGPSGAILALSIAHCYPGALLRRRRHQHAGRQLLQHGDCRLAGGVRELPAVAAGSAITSKRRVVAAAIAGYLAVNASALAGGDRVRHPARAFSRCQRHAPVCALSAEHRHSRHDDWAPYLCRISRGRDLCRAGCVPSGCRSGAVTRHLGSAGRIARRRSSSRQRVPSSACGWRLPP